MRLPMHNLFGHSKPSSFKREGPRQRKVRQGNKMYRLFSLNSCHRKLHKRMYPNQRLGWITKDGLYVSVTKEQYKRMDRRYFYRKFSRLSKLLKRSQL